MKKFLALLLVWLICIAGGAALVAAAVAGEHRRCTTLAEAQDEINLARYCEGGR